MYIQRFSFVRLLSLLCLPFLFSCVNTEAFLPHQAVSNKQIYLDAEFLSDTIISIETEQDVFRLNDEMVNVVNTQLNHKQTPQEKARALLSHLFNAENIAIQYNGSANLTATQTYNAKVANCISLTIMAYALANEAGLNVNFREVIVPEYWVRNGQYNLLTGHVNLAVKDEDKHNKTIWQDSATVIDFDPFVAKKKFPARNIKKKTVLAMFYNNKGADALANQQYTIAYQYIKQATLTDSNFSLAWGNLGVLYKHTGYEQQAEKAYIKAVTLKNDNLNALANLAILYRQQGRETQAKPIESYLHNVRAKNPYYHALLADEALYSHNYEAALTHYKKAIYLDDRQHEFFFGLAKAYYKQGELSLSKVAMKQAAKLSEKPYTEHLYLAKLNFLQHESIRLNM